MPPITRDSSGGERLWLAEGRICAPPKKGRPQVHGGRARRVKVPIEVPARAGRDQSRSNQGRASWLARAPARRRRCPRRHRSALRDQGDGARPVRRPGRGRAAGTGGARAPRSRASRAGGEQPAPEAASRPTGSPTAFRLRPRCCRPPWTPNRAAGPCSRKRWTTNPTSPTTPSGTSRDRRPPASHGLRSLPTSTGLESRPDPRG